MHNKAETRARASQSLWNQSITSLRHGATQPDAKPSLPVADGMAGVNPNAEHSALNQPHHSILGFSAPLVCSDGVSALISKSSRSDARGDLRQSLSAVATFSSVLRQMDAQTHNHSERVARNALRLAHRVGVATQDFYTLQLGALLHDCGKIGVSAQILNKPGALTEDEFGEIKKHPLHGAAILDSVPLLRLAVPIVRHHHERFDGRGYPDGLRGENIPLTARIVGLVDAFDAIISDRPYRRGVSAREARGILCENGGTQFDPELVEVFVSDNAVSV